MNDAEREVRAAWESCDVEDHRACCGFEDGKPWRAVIEPVWSAWAESPSAAWQAALAFTRERQQEIAQIEEDMEWLGYSEDIITGVHGNWCRQRILSRLTAIRDELNQGHERSSEC